METTFITIHDLSLDARLLYASNSITDILGYHPNEVVGKSCWDYFHPDEIPFARAIHGRGVQLDKAAVLNYCQIKNRDGRWVGCECVFTIVHDVMVGCTSIYKNGTTSRQRASAAPVIRQLFSSSPRDPRYHMLSYISHKFSQDIRPKRHEPRAALFLNRFSRTSTIMYATNGLADVLGITADQLNGKSFYYCIQENCLEDAVKCLESAKANDSIAYLRFLFRDPRQAGQIDGDESMDVNSSGDEEDGGVHLDDRMDEYENEHAVASDSSVSQVGSSTGQSSTDRSSVEQDSQRLAPNHASLGPNSRSSSDNSTDFRDGSNEAIFDQPATRQSSTSSLSSLSLNTPDDSNRFLPTPRNPEPRQVELEAVISCTSDGLVVVLRRARALVPQLSRSAGTPAQRSYTNGCFASPWATEPIFPNLDQRRCAQSDSFQPGLAPRWPTVAQADTASMTGPDQEDFMNSIREVAVFAWSLTGINGSLARYGRGKPTGQSLPPSGLPIWKPDMKTSAELERHPHHGNDPQETRQNHHPSESSLKPHLSSPKNASYERVNGNSHNSPNVVSNGRCHDHASNGTDFIKREHENADGFQHAAYGYYSREDYNHSDHNHSDQSYSHRFGDLDQSHAPAQFNDWYQQGVDNSYSDEYQNASLNSQNNAVPSAPEGGFDADMGDFEKGPMQYGTSGSYPPEIPHRFQYNNYRAIESEDTEMYLNGNSSENGYYGGNEVNRGHGYSWLSQSQQNHHSMPGRVHTHEQRRYEAT